MSVVLGMSWRRTGRGRTSLAAVAATAMLAVVVPPLASAAAAEPLGTGLSGTVSGPSGAESGVQIEVWNPSHADAAPLAVTTTDPSGRYVLALEPGYYRLVATPPKDHPSSLAQVAHELTVDDDGTVRDVALPVGNVRGTVTWSDGSAAAGAPVATTSVTGRTYDDGSYRLAVPQAGDHVLTATPPAQNLLLDGSATRTVTIADPGQASADNDLRLSRPTVVGSVRSPDGSAAVAAARLTVKTRSGAAVAGGTATARNDGRFGLFLSQGDYVVTAQPSTANPELWVSGTTPVTVTDAHAQAPLEVEIGLREPALKGVARKPNGAPLPYAGVYGYHPGLRVGPVGVVADVQGRYTIDLPVGDIRILAYRPAPSLDYVNADYTTSAPALGTSHDIVYPATNVRGVLLAPDGSPAPGARLSVHGDGPVTVHPQGDVLQDGRFGYRVPAGSWRLVASPPNENPGLWDPSMQSLVLEDEQVVEGLELRLTEGGTPPYALERMTVTPPDGWTVRSVERPVVSSDGSTVVAVARLEGPPVTGGDCSEGCWADSTDALVVHDLRSGAKELVLRPDGSLPDGSISARPAVSADGDVVAFRSDAQELDPADARDWEDDVYVLRRSTGAIARLSVGEAWAPSHDEELALSEDATTLAFVNERRDPDTGNRVQDLEVATLGADLAVVSRAVVASGPLGRPSLSGDGRLLSWSQHDSTSAWTLRVRDVVSGEQDAPRPLYGGDEWNLRDMPAASLDRDGSTLAYFTAVDMRDHPDGYTYTKRTPKVVDRATGAVTDVRLFGDRLPVEDGGRALALSPAGDALVVASTGDYPEEDVVQAWRHDLASGETTLVSRNAQRAPAGSDIHSVSVGPAARIVAFGHNATNLDPGSGEVDYGNRVHIATEIEDLPPTWPAGSAVTANPADVGTTSARVSWTAARDDRSVAGYLVYVDGVVRAQTSGDRVALLTGLTPDTVHRVQVQAVDAAGNESAAGPVLELRTLGSTAELVPLFTQSSPGGRAALSWEQVADADVTALVVRRAEGESPAVDVGELPAGATTFAESGLPAGRTFTYQVLARRGSATTAYTRTAQVAVGPLALTSVEFSAPVVRSGWAPLGADATIVVRGEPGRTASAVVEAERWNSTTAPTVTAPEATVLALTEDPTSPGTYRASFPLSEGTARLTAVEATLADGHGGTLSRRSTRAPLGVTGRLVVTVDAPDGGLPGATLQASSSAGAWGRSALVQGAAVESFADLVPAGDVVVDVFDSRGRSAARLADQTVRAGLVSNALLRPRLRGVLDLTVVDPDGVAVRDATLQVTDASGALQGWTSSDRSGRARLVDVPAAEEITLRATPSRWSFLQPTSLQITVAHTGSAQRVELPSPPRAQVTGLVTHPDGTPAENASVVVVQRRGEVSHTFRDTAGADGTYTVRGLEGPAEVSAAYGQLKGSTTADLTAAATTRADVAVAGRQLYTLRGSVFSQYPGQPEQFTPLDWRLDVHLGIRLKVDGRDVWTRRTYDEQGRVLFAAEAEPGETAELCLDGSQGGLRAVCTTYALQRTSTVDLELHAVADNAVTGVVLDAAGNAVTSAQASLYRLEATGRRLVRVVGVRSPLRIPLGGPGRYVLELRSGGLFASVPFNATEANHDLGTVRLRSAAVFSGDGNSVVPARPDVVPGGEVELRASWRNTGADAVSDVVAVVPVPDDATVVPGSATLDSTPVDLVLVDPQDGTAPRYELPIGSVAPSGTGVLRYRLAVPADARGTLAGAVSLRYTHLGQPTSEPLSTALVDITGVTLDLPDRLSDRRTTASGRAPAGAVVVLTTQGVVLAETVATPGGFWTTPVTLPAGAGPEPRHEVTATATLAGQESTASMSLVVDDSRPVLTSVSMYQLDGSGNRVSGRATHDPRLGVPRFPFIFVPGKATVVQLTVDEPERVTSAFVSLGGDRVEATRRADGTLEAVTTSYDMSGPVYVELDGVPTPMDLTAPAATPSEVAAALPPVMNGYSVTSQQEDASARSGSYVMAVPQMGAGASMTTSMTVTETTYTPTAADLAAERESGVAVYGVSYGLTSRGIRLSGYIPTSRYESGGGSLRTGPQTRSGLRSAYGMSAAGTAERVVKVGYEIAFNGVSSLDSALSAWGSDEKYQALDKLLDAAGGCTPGKITSYTERAKNLALVAAGLDAAGVAIQVASLVFAPATFGLGTLAIGVAGWAFDKASGYALEQAIDDLKQDIAADPDCEDDDDDDEDRKRKVLDPAWIYDPSGFVYEGMTSNRIAGVTATLLHAPAPTGPWSVWDADWYGQENPLVTDPAGRYGWDVPAGWWQVAYTKDGYEPARSRVLEVLPPHFDVNVGMTAFGLPAVDDVSAEPGAVVLTFSRPMRTATVLQDGVVTVATGGTDVAGRLAPVGPEVVEGQELARSFRFTPETAFAAGSAVALTTRATVVDHAGKVLPSDVTRQAVVPVDPAPSAPSPAASAPATGGGGSGSGEHLPVPTAAPSTTSPAGPTAAASATSRPTDPPAGPTAGPVPPGAGATTPPARACTLRPALDLLPRTVAATGASVVTVLGQPGALVDLHAYTRPSTTYRVVRSGTVGADGRLSFRVLPPANTRLYAQERGCAAGPSVVLNVRTLISLQAERIGLRTYRFSGDSLPARPGGLIVSLYRVAAGGRQVLTAQARASEVTGEYSIVRRFLVPGRFGLVVRTGQDLRNAPGTSNVRSTLVF